MSNRVQEIEVSIEEMKAVIASNEALERLTNNKDFQKIVHEGYFDQEAHRLVMAYSDPTPPGDPRITITDQKNSIAAQIAAVGLFRQYLATIQNFGRQAKNELEAYENELELRMEEELEFGEGE